MDDATRLHLNLGRELFARNDFAAAEPHLRAALASHDDLPDVHHMLGVLAHDRGAYAQARAHFERALALNPDYTEAALNLAITCNDLGLYSEARRVSEDIGARARRHARIDPYARGKLANLIAAVARAYEELGLHTEAAAEYRRALALCPDFADLRTRLAVVLRRDGQAEAALRELDAAMASDADFLPALMTRAFTLYTLRRVDEALDTWREVLRRDPQHRAAAAYLQMVDAGVDHLPSMLPPAMLGPSEAPPAPDASELRDGDFRITLLDNTEE